MSFEIEIGGWPSVSGTRVTLYADPENNRVYTFGVVGSGTPMLAFHGRQMRIGNVPVDIVPESLESWVEDHEEQITALMAEYQGCEWDGSNHVGRWSEEASGMAFAIDQALQDDILYNHVQLYWDADEWFDGDPQSVVAAAIATGSIKESVEREIADAATNGAYIEPKAAERALRCLLQKRLDNQTTAREAKKIQALLAG